MLSSSDDFSVARFRFRAISHFGTDAEDKDFSSLGSIVAWPDQLPGFECTMVIKTYFNNTLYLSCLKSNLSMWEQFFFELNLRNPNLMYAYCSHDFTRQYVLRQREREIRNKSRKTTKLWEGPLIPLIGESQQ